MRRCCREARAQGRIGKVAADPLLPLRAFIDIGGAGATADAFTIWIVQWVGAEIRVLDYYESWPGAGVSRQLAANAAMRTRSSICPHDGVHQNNITGKRYEDHLREAGFIVEPPVKNQGKGGDDAHRYSRRPSSPDILRWRFLPEFDRGTGGSPFTRPYRLPLPASSSTHLSTRDISAVWVF